MHINKTKSQGNPGIENLHTPIPGFPILVILKEKKLQSNHL